MAILLTDAELTALRLDMGGLLVQSVAIQRASETVNSAGDAVPTWSTSSTVDGRVDPMKSGSAQARYMIGDQEKGKAMYQLTVAHDADLRDGDRVVVDGATYQVLQMHSGNALAAVKRALVSKQG